MHVVRSSLYILLLYTYVHIYCIGFINCKMRAKLNKQKMEIFSKSKSKIKKIRNTVRRRGGEGAVVHPPPLIPEKRLGFILFIKKLHWVVKCSKMSVTGLFYPIMQSIKYSTSEIFNAVKI